MFFLLSSCAANQLETRHADYAKPIEGNTLYTDLFYGGAHPPGPESIVILYPENGPYKIVPSSNDVGYTKKEHLKPTEALLLAYDYLGYKKHPERLQMRAIKDRKGTLAGYDLRPPFYTTYGQPGDIIDAKYYLKGNGIVEAWISFPIPVPQGSY
ncbi:MAG: hypothetical protein M0018_04335 [Nitrospiraceae bacterium]|nr:hypothetical protein [Nitrospiraceae bacterium]